MIRQMLDMHLDAPADGKRPSKRRTTLESGASRHARDLDSNVMHGARWDRELERCRMMRPTPLSTGTLRMVGSNGRTRASQTETVALATRAAVPSYDPVTPTVAPVFKLLSTARPGALTMDGREPAASAPDCKKKGIDFRQLGR